MDIFDGDDLKELLGKQKGICVSIYIPTFEKGPETEQNQIRFKNALNKAEKALDEIGNHGLKSKEYLEPARKLLKEDAFWQNQGKGLAFFLSEAIGQTFRLPTKFQELTVVTDRFHLKPLLPLIMGDSTFYLLALSQQSARLFQGDRHYLEQIVIENMPHGISEALRFEESEKQLQFHTGTSGSVKIRPAFFHGHGVGTDDKKDKILRYCREINRAVQGHLRDKKFPMLLACVEYLFPIYREVNTYPCLLNRYLNGNPDRLNGPELHGPAWSLMEKYFRNDLEKALEELEELKQTQQASKDLKTIIRSAVQGRVKSLFMAEGVQKWGLFDERDNSVEMHPERRPGDMDLLDFAAIEIITKGGSAYLLSPETMPDNVPAAAVFRY